MSARVAFLRAVNLGRRTVPNARLVEIAAGLGCDDPWSYVNSGNLVIDASGQRAGVERSFEQSLEKEFGFEVTTFVRSVIELRKVLAADPFDVRVGDTYFVTFLKTAASEAQARALEALSNDFDTLVVRGRDVHWLMHGKSTDTALPTRAWDDVIGHHHSTSRNTTMLRKLLAKVDERSS